MSHSLPNSASPAHRVNTEKERVMLKASLRKAESPDLWREIGACVDFARRSQGWTLDELAGQLPPPTGSEKRDPRQVARWIRGEERPLVDVVFAVAALRGPFVIALARLAGCCEEETTLRFRRTA
jgi:hypothetical protein